jgi:hypothetical protein
MGWLEAGRRLVDRQVRMMDVIVEQYLTIILKS